MTADVGEDHGALLAGLALEPGSGLALDAPAVRDRRAGRIWWRVRVQSEGWSEVAVVDDDGGRWTKQVKAERGNRRHGLVRERGGLWTALAHPAEAPLPSDATISAIEIHRTRPEAEWYAQGWFWWFCVISVVAGLAVKSAFKVEI